MNEYKICEGCGCVIIDEKPYKILKRKGKKIFFCSQICFKQFALSDKTSGTRYAKLRVNETSSLLKNHLFDTDLH